MPAVGNGWLAVPFAHAGPGAPTPLELMADWRVDPGITAWLVVAAAAYVVGARRTSRVGSPWPHRRTAAFLAGLVVLAVGLQSGLDSHGTELLSVHMLQHLLITLVAPPLLLLGAPVSLALRTLTPAARRSLAGIVTGRLARTAAHPAVAWSVFTAVLVGTHFSPLYDAAVRSEPLHALEHALYIGSGLLFWVPLVGADPAPRPTQPAIRMLYMLLAMPPMALVGVALVAGQAVRYPAYLEPARALELSALGDQEAAGMIMWLGGSLALVAATLAVGWAALVREERRAVTRESYSGDRGEQRAATRVPAAGGPRR